MTEKSQRQKRDLLLVLLAAPLIMAPSYVASIGLQRWKIPIEIAAIMSLGLFLIGVFLLLKVVKD